jgi:hypothetical protein
VSHGEDDTSFRQSVHGVHDACDFWSGGDDPHAEGRVGTPVLGRHEVLGAVGRFEGADAIGGGEKEGGSVGTSFGWLEERAFSVPAEKGCGGRGRRRTEEVENSGVERFLLCLLAMMRSRRRRDLSLR